MWGEAKEAWFSKKGTLVLCLWGSAISSITLWAYFRRPYEKQIEKEIIVDLPQSTFYLPHINKEDLKEDTDGTKNDDEIQPESEPEPISRSPKKVRFAAQSMFIDPSTVNKLHKEQSWR